jgi:hypothetical protein
MKQFIVSLFTVLTAVFLMVASANAQATAHVLNGQLFVFWQSVSSGTQHPTITPISGVYNSYDSCERAKNALVINAQVNNAAFNRFQSKERYVVGTCSPK